MLLRATCRQDLRAATEFGPAIDRMAVGPGSIGSLFRHLWWRKHDDDLQILSDLGEVMFSTGVDRDHTARPDGISMPSTSSCA